EVLDRWCLPFPAKSIQSSSIATISEKTVGPLQIPRKKKQHGPTKESLLKKKGRRICRPRVPSFAIVVPRARRRLTRDAGDRAQIFVDRTEVMVRHIVIDRPWHYLEKSAVERSGQTIPVGSPSTCWME